MPVLLLSWVSEHPYLKPTLLGNNLFHMHSSILKLVAREMRLVEQFNWEAQLVPLEDPHKG